MIETRTHEAPRTTRDPGVIITYRPEPVRGRAVVLLRPFLIIPLLLWTVVWSIWALWTLVICTAIIIKGRNPDWFWDPVARWARYLLRVTAYVSLLTHSHPGWRLDGEYALDAQLTHAPRQSRWLAVLRIVLNAPLGTVLALIVVADILLSVVQFIVIVFSGRRSTWLLRWQLGCLTLEFRGVAFALALTDHPPRAGARMLP